MSIPTSRALVAGGAAGVILAGAALAVPAQAAVEPGPTTQVQILGTNDFHGRISASSSTAGAAKMAGVVAQLEEEYPNSVLAAAGDLIGASTFESFIAHDKPTIDALNAMGLDVSAVGNHEFDQGYDDLVNRVLAPYDAATNPFGGATWAYLGANVRFVDTGNPALDETWIQDFGTVQVGFVGVVTDETPSLVSPAGIEGLEFIDEAEAANDGAAALEAEGADVVVLLVHEGAPTTAYADAVDTSNDFGAMLAALDPSIDAVISGHTHQRYDHKVPVQAWVEEGRSVTERPVVSAGQYGMYLNRLIFTVDDATGDVVAQETSIVDLIASGATPDAEVAGIVSAAVTDSNALGAAVLGQMDQPLYRAALAGGTPGSSRGAESTLGNAVAEVQRWATTELGADIAFMNPGGLRADMLGAAAGTGAYPSDITYKEAAAVQPFANTLVTMTMTGEQLASVLEEQWQPAGSTRAFLRLGTSDGFVYTYDPSTRTILQMWLDGDPIAPTDTFTVTVNSFLASGGDNFFTFAEGSNKADSGRIDLTAMVDYLAAEGSLGTDYAQHAVGLSGTLSGTAGEEIAFDLTSLMMTGPGDLVDSTVAVSLDGAPLGTFPVTNAASASEADEHGTASVAVTIPAATAAGTHTLMIEGDVTGTEVPVAIEVAAAPVPDGDSSTSAGVTLEVPAGEITAFEVVTEAASGAADAGFDYPVGLFSFAVSGLEAGASLPISIALDKAYDTTGWTFRKLIGGAFQAGPPATFSTVDGVTVIEFTLVDGGPFDADGKADGTITDPSGPATAVATAAPTPPSTGTGGTGGTTGSTGNGTTGSTGPLARTGVDDLAPRLAVTGALMAMGIALVIAARRRRLG